MSTVVLLALAAAAPAASSGDSGLRGRVVAAPTCPVETVPPSAQCAPRAVAARVRVYRRFDQHTVARVRTSADGRFEVRLAPGRYAVAAHPLAGGPLPRCPAEARVNIHARRYTHISIQCDSGIR